MNSSQHEALGAHVCERTGLMLMASPTQAVFRVARPSYGALNPPVRPPDFGSVAEWNRWDTAGGRTVYWAEQPALAYIETLAPLRVAPSLADTRIADVFPEGSMGNGATLGEAIAREWRSSFGDFTPGKNPKRWREDRALYEGDLPIKGWFIDVSHVDSVAALNRVNGPLAGPLFRNGEWLTKTHLYSDDRRLTCGAATALRNVVLGDGSLAHGITYSSKHGDGEGRLWAYWLRRVDDGYPPDSEPISVGRGLAIADCSMNPDLRRACEVLGIQQF